MSPGKTMLGREPAQLTPQNSCSSTVTTWLTFGLTPGGHPLEDKKRTHPTNGH